MHVFAYVLLGAAAAMLSLPIAFVVCDEPTVGGKLGVTAAFVYVFAFLVGLPLVLLGVVQF